MVGEKEAVDKYDAPLRGAGRRRGPGRPHHTLALDPCPRWGDDMVHYRDPIAEAGSASSGGNSATAVANRDKAACRNSSSLPTACTASEYRACASAFSDRRSPLS